MIENEFYETTSIDVFFKKKKKEQGTIKQDSPWLIFPVRSQNDTLYMEAHTSIFDAKHRKQ
jgi:hypothetical protein